LLIEYRGPYLFDINMWTSGITVYHVDMNTNGTGNVWRGFPGEPGWPGNGDHYQVALLQADGLYQLEQALDDGDATDFWLPGKTLGPGNGELVATSSGTYPNTDSYAFGNIKVTNLVLTNFQTVSPGVASFEVQGLGSSSTPTYFLKPGRLILSIDLIAGCFV